jgi:hypothetical protein
MKGWLLRPDTTASRVTIRGLNDLQKKVGGDVEIIPLPYKPVKCTQSLVVYADEEGQLKDGIGRNIIGEDLLMDIFDQDNPFWDTILGLRGNLVFLGTGPDGDDKNLSEKSLSILESRLEKLMEEEKKKK